jgi:phosphoesterase RecJ-like protein
MESPYSGYIRKIKELLSSHPKIVVISHLNPDGDAIGSMLGLYQWLKKAGYEVSAISPNDFPRFLKWMPGQEEIILAEKKAPLAVKLIAEAGIIFSLDFNDPKRLGIMERPVQQSAAFKLLIDHHPDPVQFTEITLSDTHVSSTAELIYELIRELGDEVSIDASVAVCLYAGIMTDTGCFSYNSSRPRTFQVVAELLATGFDKNVAYAKTYDNFSVHRMQLLGYCLNRKMEILPGYHTAIVSLSREEQEKYQFEIGDSEGFVNYPLSIHGINFSVLFLEKKGYTKLSFRSKGTFKVNKMASMFFNGGGHDNAAGGEYSGTLDEALQRFREVLPLFQKELDYELA